MSVFRVKLNNINQGLLDRDPSTMSAGAIAGQGLGSQMAASKQRTVYVTGPNRINRKLVDGQTFTDCNYWKQYAYPQVPYDQAFIEVVTDDGSVWSANDAENVYPKVYDLTIAAGSTYTTAANIADVATDTGGYAVFAQVTNKGEAANDLRMKINDTAIMDLPGASTQVFQVGDLVISKLAFDNTASGAAETLVQVVLSVKSKVYS